MVKCLEICHENDSHPREGGRKERKKGEEKKKSETFHHDNKLLCAEL